MDHAAQETLLFFDGHTDALPLFTAFEEKLYALFPDTGKRVQKTQITYFNRHVFACVSFLRAKKKAELPPAYITLTLGLPYALQSGRVAVAVEPYPGRWTAHFVISSLSDLDGELFDWVKEAYDFAQGKR